MIEVAPGRTITEWTVERVVPRELPELGVTPVARQLLGAAMLLERDGWCQNKARSNHGQRCLATALHDALPMSIYGGWSATYLADKLGLPIPYWNDQPGRQVGEVIATLHIAALQATADGI